MNLKTLNNILDIIFIFGFPILAIIFFIVKQQIIGLVVAIVFLSWIVYIGLIRDCANCPFDEQNLKDGSGQKCPNDVEGGE